MKKVCVIASQRSGSTWLIELLNTIKGASVYGELFIDRSKRGDPAARVAPKIISHLEPTVSRPPWRRGLIPRWRETLQFLKAVEEASAADSQILAFKLMYNQLAIRPELYAILGAQRYSMIHLVRENALQQLISAEAAKLTRVYHSAKATPQTRVALDPGNILRDLRALRTASKRHRRRLRVLPVSAIEIRYEKLVESPAVEIERVADFLDGEIGDYASSTNLKKMNTSRPSERIENYHEIAAVLQGTEFESLLE